MTKNFALVFCVALLATACGSGNDNAPVTTGVYSQGAYGGAGPASGGYCPPQVTQDWNQLVAAPCSGANGPGSTYCARGIEEMIARDQAYLQGPGCTIYTNQVRWCPGDNWRSQQGFQVNMPILQSLLTQYGGPSSVPVNGGRGYPYR